MNRRPFNMYMYIHVYIYIILQAEGELEQFLKEEHSFLEYEKLVYKYKELVSELQYSVEKVYIYVHMHTPHQRSTPDTLSVNTRNYVYMYIYTCTYIYRYIYIYTCIYIYIQMLLCVLRTLDSDKSFSKLCTSNSKAKLLLKYQYCTVYSTSKLSCPMCVCSLPDMT